MAAAAARIGTTFQRRKEIQAKLGQALLDVYLLYAQGVLDGREALLVDTEINSARQRLTYTPPTDFANGIYISSVEPFFPLLMWHVVIRRRNDQDMPLGESPRREILQIVAQSLETDIRILDGSHMPTYCEGCTRDELVKQGKALKAKLARITQELSQGQ